MPRSTIVLATLFGVLAGIAGTFGYLWQAKPDTDAVRAVVEEVLAGRAPPVTTSATGVSSEALNPMIESYLLANPRILEKMSVALEAEVRAQEIAVARAAIASMSSKIFDDPGQVVLGNPDGDVTLVEMFDYNCGYCRQALPDLIALLEDDTNLRIVLKEFPILSQESVDAARVAVVVARSGASYLDFHKDLFSGRGQITGPSAIDAAVALGLDKDTVTAEMNSEAVSGVIQVSYEIAQALSISGTPTYIIGDEILPGAIGVEELRPRIANMRACGKTVCDG